MKIVTSNFLILFFTVCSSSSTSLECSFDLSEINGLNYSCVISPQNSVTFDDETEVIATHFPSKTDLDVDAFIMAEVQIKIFPNGIEKFTKIILLSIFACGLEKITQNDLKTFKDLKFLTLSENKISVIEPELFKFNLNLEEIDLEQNPIIHIDPLVFDELEVLSLINLKNISCEIKGGSVDEIIEEIEGVKCAIKDWKLIHEGYERIVRDERFYFELVEGDFRNCSKDVQKLQENLEVSEGNLQNLTETLRLKCEKVEKLEENLGKFQQENFDKIQIFNESLNFCENENKILTKSVLDFQNQIKEVNQSCSNDSKVSLVLFEKDETELERIKGKFVKEIESLKKQLEKCYENKIKLVNAKEIDALKIDGLQNQNSNLQNLISDQKFDIENLKTRLKLAESSQKYSSIERAIFITFVGFLASIALIFMILYCRLMTRGESYIINSEDLKETKFERGEIEIVKY